MIYVKSQWRCAFMKYRLNRWINFLPIYDNYVVAIFHFNTDTYDIFIICKVLFFLRGDGGFFSSFFLLQNFKIFIICISDVM
jgi:hypothetical protein